MWWNLHHKSEEDLEKLLVVSQATENPADVNVTASRERGQQTMWRFAAATGATEIAGHITSGAFTNQIHVALREALLPFCMPSWVKLEVYLHSYFTSNQDKE